MKRANHHITPASHQIAKKRRRESTPAGSLLWCTLREQKSFKFRRQQPILNDIADFACMISKLVIERDGHTHDQTIAADKKRDTELQKRGYQILRFTNDDAYKNIAGIVETILTAAQTCTTPPPSPPSPSLPSRGGGQ